MNLGNLRSRIEDLYGPASTDEESYYNRVINDQYKVLASITNWWWLEKQAIFTTIGTAQEIEVVGTDGSNKLEPASSALMVADYDNGWLSTGEHTYRITDAANSSGEIVLDSNWIEDTDSDATVYIWNDIYELPSDYGDIITVAPRNYPNYKPLRHVPHSQILSHGPDLYSKATERAQMFCVYKESDKDSYTHLRIYPPPSEEIDYLISYIADPVTLSSDSDTPILPAKHHEALAALAVLRIVKDRRSDQDVVANCELDAQRALQRLWRDQRASRGIKYRAGRRGSRRAEIIGFKAVNYTSDSP